MRTGCLAQRQKTLDSHVTHPDDLLHPPNELALWDFPHELDVWVAIVMFCGELAHFYKLLNMHCRLLMNARLHALSLSLAAQAKRDLLDVYPQPRCNVIVQGYKGISSSTVPMHV